MGTVNTKTSIAKRLRPYLPNSSNRLALVSLADQRPFRAFWHVRVTQIIGSRRWSLSIIRLQTPRPTKVETSTPPKVHADD